MDVSPLVFINLPTEDEGVLFDVDLDEAEEPVDAYAVEAAALREELKNYTENKLPAYEAAIDKDTDKELKDVEEIKFAAKACIFVLNQPVPRRDEALYMKAAALVKKRLEKKK